MESSIEPSQTVSSSRIAAFSVGLNRGSRIVAAVTRQLMVIASFVLTSSLLQAQEPIPHDQAYQAQLKKIPILGTTYDHNWEQIGVVARVDIQLERREDHSGLKIQFNSTPGRFSATAQNAVIRAISWVVDASHSDARSWTVTLSLPYPGVTMYGESLSAMVGLSVLALAKGDPLPPDRVVTGTVTSDGQIGTVGGVPLKILAAHKEHLRKVLIPEEKDVADGDWQTPFLMEVSPVRSLSKAYQALTDRPFRSTSSTNSFMSLH